MSTKRPAHFGGEPIRDDVLGYGAQSITKAEKEAVTEALDGDYITRGPLVDEFEGRVADMVGVDHAIATTSGTTALHLAGRAAGFGPGDEVITTPLTFVSTAHTATYSGAEPVFADIDPESRTLDPDCVRRRITENTTGLVPMHYGGHPADIDLLLDLAEEHDLSVIWDACHAFGGTYRGTPIGAQPDMAAFSFHPVKTITTAEGGMVVTDDDDVARKLRRLRSFEMDYDPPGHDDEPWYQVVEGLGYNYNFTDIQAALGCVQLDRLDDFKSRRGEIIDQYDEAFESMEGIRLPPTAGETQPCHHLYAIQVEDGFGYSRKEFVEAMHAENIGVQVHYVPLHYHPYFQEQFGYAVGDFPNTERVYDGLVSLPLFPEMTDADVEDVVHAVTRIHEYPG